MRPILAGTETEYGLSVEGRETADQIEDATALVRSYPDECFVGWDYRFESPRSDLRGFHVDRLAFDPEDAKFDEGRKHGSDAEVRADRVLPTGARLYNDHGHPEYATPECWGLQELALQDALGEEMVLKCARAMEASTGRRVQLYKNNTDFHGASYGTHESYLMPRALGAEALIRGLLPMLVARQVLTGAGKVGSEAGAKCDYQMSQRADFFSEPVNVETLYRRPVFNTRDEPHADPNEWIRVHVISCDANMMPGCTRRRVGLAKMALHLTEAEMAPPWPLADPVRAFREISRSLSADARIELDGGSWTTPRQVLESYFDAAVRLLEEEGIGDSDVLTGEMQVEIGGARALLEHLERDFAAFASHVDWAAKKQMLDDFLKDEGQAWDSERLASYDLAYSLVDPRESLFAALVDLGLVEPAANEGDLNERRRGPVERTRAFARSEAVKRYGNNLKSLSWGTLTFKEADETRSVKLPPDKVYPADLSQSKSLAEFVDLIESA
jgi:proteasome accessory factor A